MQPELGPDENRINLGWLIWLRWGVVLGQLTTVMFARSVLGVEVALPPLLTLIGAQAISNAGLTLWARRQTKVSKHVLGVVMAVDVVLFTLVLHFSGGVSNPFSFLYLINIALAAVVLGGVWTWILVVASVLGLAALYLLADGHEHNHRIMELHLYGMGVAYAVASSFIVYFIGRVSRALRERERALQREQERAEAAHRLAALTTLAAGAAHELATPLSTIEVVAHELERNLDPSALSDVALIRNEVKRCKGILDRMSAQAGEQAGEAFVTMTFGELITEAVAKTSAPARVQVNLAGLEREPLWGPRAALSSTVAAVINNGLAASDQHGVVRVRGGSDPWLVEITDEGTGMSPEIARRATEPFFSTREAGKGMGLGLFLAQVLLSRLGGSVEITSQLGQGTTVTLRWPKSEVREP